MLTGRFRAFLTKTTGPAKKKAPFSQPPPPPDPWATFLLLVRTGTGKKGSLEEVEGRTLAGHRTCRDPPAVSAVVPQALASWAVLGSAFPHRPRPRPICLSLAPGGRGHGRRKWKHVKRSTVVAASYAHVPPPTSATPRQHHQPPPLPSPLTHTHHHHHPSQSLFGAAQRHAMPSLAFAPPPSPICAGCA